MMEVRQRRKGRHQRSSQSAPARRPSSRKRGPPGWRRILLFSLLTLIGTFGGVLFILPDDVDPVAFTLPPPPKLSGALTPNTVLQRAEKVLEGQLPGPESLAIDEDKGLLYTGLADGSVVAVDLRSREVTEIIERLGLAPCGGPTENEENCGRPLGIAIEREGFIIVLDSYLGIFRVDVTAEGSFGELFYGANLVEGKPIKFLNAGVFHPNGSMFLTHSSTKFQRRHYFPLVTEGSANGRVLRRDKDGRVHEVLGGIAFANGLVLTPDASALLICETTRARVLRLHLTGPKAGQTDIFADNLPALPDNITPSSRGGYWVGTTSIRHADRSLNIMDMLSRWPLIRRLLFKVLGPGVGLSLMPKYGLVLELDSDGRIVRSLHDPSGNYSAISEVREFDGALWMGSYIKHYLLRLPLDQID